MTFEKRGKGNHIDGLSSVNTNLCAAIKVIVKLTTVNFLWLYVHKSYVFTCVCLNIIYTHVDT